VTKHNGPAPLPALPERKGGRARLAGIHRVLRDRICFFDYPPGALLSEARLAAEFGVSRTPIRQALQRLEFERLVDVRDGIGTIVTGVDFAALRGVYALRLRITEMIGDFSPAAAPDEAVADILGLIDRAMRQRAEPDVRAFWRIENDRHRLINALIGNEALKELHDRLFTQTARVWYGIVENLWAEAIEALTDELVELRRAIRAGDMRAVGLVSRNYVSYSVARFERYFAEHRQPAEPASDTPLTSVDFAS
jgi:DNA-binding GntR family transcriptional regulator